MKIKQNLLQSHKDKISFQRLFEIESPTMAHTVERVPYNYTFFCLDEATGENIPVSTGGYFVFLDKNGNPCTIGDSNKVLCPEGHFSVQIFPGEFHSTNSELNKRLTMGAMINCDPKLEEGKIVKSDPAIMPPFSQVIKKFPESSILTENPDEVDENGKLKGKFYAESSSRAAAGLGLDSKCIAVTQTSGLVVVELLVFKKPLPPKPRVEYSTFRDGNDTRSGTRGGDDTRSGTRGGDDTHSGARGGPSREVANITRGDAVTNIYGSCNDRYVTGSLIEKQVRFYVLMENENVKTKAEELFKPMEEDEFVPIELPEPLVPMSPSELSELPELPELLELLELSEPPELSELSELSEPLETI